MSVAPMFWGSQQGIVGGPRGGRGEGESSGKFVVTAVNGTYVRDGSFDALSFRTWLGIKCFTSTSYVVRRTLLPSGTTHQMYIRTMYNVVRRPKYTTMDGQCKD